MSNAPWHRFDPARQALILVLHVQPGARHTEISGIHGEALKIRLAAPPVEGKANEALIAFLAEAFGVPQRRVRLLRGETSRAKQVEILAPAQRPDLKWGGELS